MLVFTLSRKYVCRLYLLSSHVSTLVTSQHFNEYSTLLLLTSVVVVRRHRHLYLLSSLVSTYHEMCLCHTIYFGVSGTNCTYEKPRLTSKQNMAQIYVGTVIEFPRKVIRYVSQKITSNYYRGWRIKIPPQILFLSVARGAFPPFLMYQSEPCRLCTKIIVPSSSIHNRDVSRPLSACYLK